MTEKMRIGPLKIIIITCEGCKFLYSEEYFYFCVKENKEISSHTARDGKIRVFVAPEWCPYINNLEKHE